MSVNNDISFTFGIITDGNAKSVKQDIITSVNSIRNLKIPGYEIIIVGNESILRQHADLNKDCKDIRVIDFDENQKSKWITRKKNLITQNAKYDNVVYLHDYIIFKDDWYEGWKKFGDNYHACMNKIENLDGTRFRDWVVFPWHLCYSGELAKSAKELWDYSDIHNNESLIPYHVTELNKWQYFSGSYWVAKKQIMQEMPLNENLVWDQGEDCDWSMKFSNKYQFSMNHFSTVKFLKQKQDAFGLIRPECLERAIEFAKRNK